MTVEVAVIVVLAVWAALMLAVGAVIERYAPFRDEDDELMHPLGNRRLP